MLGLCREIRSAAGRGDPLPLIAVDQEGGRVARLKDPPFTWFPPARACSLFCCGNESVAEGVGAATAAELRAVGIDMNFAPVLDVDSNPRNPVIGDRSFSEDPHTAAALGIAFAKGSLSRGILPVGKHFPGHGDTFADSHKELPVVRAGRQTLLRRELLPFRLAARAGIPALMTAHVLYPALDRALPATLSRKILYNLLRERLRFRGAVLSDALEMKAIADRFGIGEAAALAVTAGCDVVLVCRGRRSRRRRSTGWPGRPGTGLRSSGRWRRRRFGRGGFGRGRRRKNVVGGPRGRWGRHGIDGFLPSCGRLGKVPGEHLRAVNPVILEKVEEDPAQVEARLLVIDPFEERRRIAVRPFPPAFHRRFPRVVRRHRPEIVPPNSFSRRDRYAAPSRIFTAGRSSSFLPGFGIFSFRAASAAVRGISCIRPTAPAEERTSDWKRDSWRMTAWRTSGSIPERRRSQSARNSGARGY